MVITSNWIFVNCSRFIQSFKFIQNCLKLLNMFMKWAGINVKKNERCFSLLGIFNCYNSSMSYYLLCTTFSGWLFFLGMELLNWLKRNAKSGGSCRIRKLLEFFDSLLLLLMKPINVLSFQVENKTDITMVRYKFVNICIQNNSGHIKFHYHYYWHF